MNELPKQIRILKNEPILFLTLPISLPILIIIILISPIIHIRIGFLHNDRIGHFSLNTELYLLEKKHFKEKLSSIFKIDLFYLPRKNSCNKTLEKLWRQKLIFLPKIILRPLCLIIRSSRVLSKYFRCGDTSNGERDIHGLLDIYSPTIKLSEEFISKGKEELKKIGIPESAKIVCLIARDKAYLRKIYKVDAAQHNYRDVDINDFIPAAEELTKHGYYVLRMGSVVSKSMNVKNKFIIDYAYDGHRTDFLDIYLGATCEFCITTSLGFDNIPMIFRRPNLYINHAPLFWLRLERKDNIEVPAIYYSNKLRKYLTLSDTFKDNISDILRSEIFNEKNITIIQNSPEDIQEAAIEMVFRLNKKWKSTQEESDLQNKFKEIFPNKRIINNMRYHGEINSNIGSNFLKKNRWWIK